MANRIGSDCKLYRNTGTVGAPTWNLVALVRDAALSCEATLVEVASRNSGGFKAYMSALKDATIELTLLYDTTDPDLVAFLAAYFGAKDDTSGTAQAGAAATITLASGSNTITDYYVGDTITIASGTGAGQSRTISAYNGTTKVATVSSNWTTPPDATSVYAITGVWATNIVQLMVLDAAYDSADPISQGLHVQAIVTHVGREETLEGVVVAAVTCKVASYASDPLGGDAGWIIND